MKTRIVLAVLMLAFAAFASVGCAKKAPQLTPQQLAAGIVPPQGHPVSQADATAQGCACHLQQ